MKKLFTIILSLVLLTACASAPSPVTEVRGDTVLQIVDPPDGIDAAEIAEFSENYVTISVPIPEGWSYRANERIGEPYGQGLTIWRTDDDGCQISIRYTTSFGICGTGLVETEADFPSGEKAKIGYYDGSEDWNFVWFYDTVGEYWVVNTNFTGEDAIAALEIVGSAKLGGDWLNRSQIEAIACEGQPDSDRVYTNFDPETGIWTVTMIDDGNDEPVAVVTVDAEGNIV